MEKNVPCNSNKKSSTVKEISDGVYINLDRITSEESEFERAIEKSFQELAKEEKIEETDQKSKKPSRTSK